MPKFALRPLYFFYSLRFLELPLTAPFNNTRTLKFKAQPTNACFATVNQMFGGSSQPPTTAERAVIKSLSMHSSDIETVLGTFKRRE